MILYSLQIVVKEKTKNIASSDFRRLILTLTDGFPNEIKLKINFHINGQNSTQGLKATKKFKSSLI